jgi:predicted esterase
MSDPCELHSYEIPLKCEFLFSGPVKTDSGSALILTLHGYGSNAHDMFRLTRAAVGPKHAIVSLQAPHQHYAGTPGLDSPAAYNWGIRQHWEEAARLHHSMIRAVISRVTPMVRIGPDRTILMGFSQPVGLNYRFVGTNPGAVRGVIAICGGVPRDWHEPKYGPVDAAILHISRDQDEFYPVETVKAFPEKLRLHASDVEFHLLPGAHRFPSQAGSVIQPWLRRVCNVEA